MNEGAVAKNFFNVFDLTSNQIFAFGVFVIVVGAFLAYLSKKGLFSFQGKGLQFGRGQDLERTIIRRQLEYVDAAVEEAFTEIEHTDTWEEWKSRFVAEKVKDCLQRTISFNHISNEKSYVSVKKLEVWAAIQSIGMTHQYYKSQEFKDLVYKWVEDTLEDLLSIRKHYETAKFD